MTPHCLLASSADNDLAVRLLTPLTSYRTKPGAIFQCVVLRDFVVDQLVVIPRGATVHGHVNA